MTVLDRAGKPMELRKKLGEGGEGAVWASPLASDVAIKTYLKAMPSAKVDKLQAMTSMVDASLLSAAAWPMRVVYDARMTPIGFEMPKLSGQKPFHDIIGTKSRKTAFPNANWGMLVHAAVNVARAFEGLHSKNIVVGDVNSNNVVVRDDSCVYFIDCDSFQIKTPNRTFRCEVGVPDYQPPELQNVPFANVDRSPLHDCFGMAIMIFQLLFVGKHPFAGRLPNPSAVAPTPGENIADGNYFYDARAQQRGLLPPPASLTISAVTPDVAKLFERAFRGLPHERPSPREWIGALADLERSIITCKADAAHRYRNGPTCPWCAIELQSKIVYFSAPTLITASGDIDESIWSTFPNAEAERLWSQISAVAPPNVAFEPIRAEPAAGKPISKTAHKSGAVFVEIFAALLILAIVIWYVPMIRAYDVLDAIVVVGFWMFGRPSGGSEFIERKITLQDAKDAFEKSEAIWKTLCDGGDFRVQLQRLAAIHVSMLAQRAVHDSEISQVRRTGEEKAKRHYLDSQFIRGAKIRGIGDKLATRLAAADVETALDIDNRILGVSGIGEQKAFALFEWRRAIELQFRFEPKMIEGLIRDVKTKHVQERTHGRNALLSGARLLREAGALIESRAPEIRAKAIRDRKLLDQAQADVRQFSPLIFR